MSLLPDRYVIGVDLGGTKIHTALADGDGNILAETRVPTETIKGPSHVIGRIIATIEQVREQAGLPAGFVETVSVGSPGPLDIASGIIHFSPNLGWHEVPLKKLLQEGLRTKVMIDNDANLAALGEHVFGAGRGVNNMVYITVSTGVGGGLILGGRLYHGATDGAGEIGHITVLPDGPPCGCGARGCLESVSSGTAIAREARRLVECGKGQNILTRAGGDPDRISAVTVAEAASGGDQEAVSIISNAARFLGIGVANVINLLNPDMIVLGGGVMEIGEPIWQGVRQEVEARTLGAARTHVQVVPAGLGRRAGVLGAVALALQMD
ncbi:ROK family protein [Pelotomaculum isophthalicicum JI]|uniref:ROK family protein n=1 Tax=Pelotomaculum isophthalicicum JI TaxID=947010 RepID=A0A9X4H548_9FIRM|nr:ROK family protein [Pelotomaculum isophthalicicum]MDF9408177.1 ROK family protein [Pelotomaculum isophthalicicum JI]